ncbi:MAG: T9SS type A sorting domain-containing protein [Bacteroidales bacterium]|nr:T9SS type A sorting domain-containing protein [Bacteroidales bacterium]
MRQLTLKTILFLSLLVTSLIGFSQFNLENTFTSTSSNTQFGKSVDRYYDYAIVGAPNDMDMTNEAGAAYIYQYDGTSWSVVKKIFSASPFNHAHFGTSVAIYGDFAFVGAPEEDSGNGAVYIYNRNEGGYNNWGHFYTLTGNSAAQFGYSIAVDNEYLIIGEPYTSSGGIAYIFYQNESGPHHWGLVKTIAPTSTQAGANFGASVSLYNNTAVVGASNYNSTGAAFIFERDQNGADQWGQWTVKFANIPSSSEYFGSAVDLSDTILVVGAYNSNAGLSGCGAAYVFYKDNGSPGDWGQVKKLTSSHSANNAYFGTSVSISSENILVGAPGYQSYAGEAVLFKMNNGGDNNWGEISNFQSPSHYSSEYFGQSINLFNDIFLVGATSSPSADGAVYCYKSTTNTGCMFAQYKMDGDLNEVSANNNGTINGPTSDNDRFGAPGSALHFDGTDDFGYITTGMNNMSQGAVSIWAYVDDPTSFPVFTRPGTNAGDIDLQLILNGNTQEFTLANTTLNNTDNLSVNNWHHFVCSWDGASMFLYIDGVLRNEMVNALGTINTTGSDFVLGNDNSGIYFANGRMDDLKFFDCPLTEPEVEEIYTENGWGQTYSCIKNHYPFDGNADDYSISMQNGMTNNAIAGNDRFDNGVGALFFESANVSLPDGVISEIPEGSVSVWIKPNTSLSFYYFPIIESATAATPELPYFKLYIEEYELKANIYDLNTPTENEIYSSNYLLNGTDWHQVGVSWDADSIKFFIDGKIRESIYNSFGAYIPLNSAPTIIGEDYVPNWAEGYFDDLKIFTCTLTADQIDEMYHDGGYGYPDFVDQCFNFNDNTYPSNWELYNTTNASIENGKFMVYNDGTDQTAELGCNGQLPLNTDSLIIEWQSQTISTNPFHFTGVGLKLADTSLFFVHMQNPTYDFGAIAVGGNEDVPLFLAADSISINTGIYNNKLICTNSTMYFVSQKATNANVVPFEIEFNPFTIDPTYSLEKIRQISLIQQAGPQASYNWIDNVCIKIIEASATESCELAFYKFNANISDHSGNGNHLQVENGPFNYATNRFNIPYGALSINGTNQEFYTIVEAPSLYEDCSVSAWIKPNDYDSNDTAMIFVNYHESDPGSSFMVGIFEATGKLFYGHYNNDGSLFASMSDNPIPTNVWTHVVVVRDDANSRYTLYLNNDSINSFIYPNPPTQVASVSAFAVSSSDPGYCFYGDVDDIIVSQCIMNENTVDSLYHVNGWPSAMCDNMVIAITKNPASCGEDNGSAMVTVSGGSGYYNVSWSNGDEGYYAVDLSSGVHSVNVTDSIYGCMINQFFTINNTDAPVIQLTPSNLSCFNNHTGSVSMNITGGTSPYNIEWSNGQTTQNIGGLTAGNYSVTIVDQNGCVSYDDVLLTQPNAISASFSVTNSSCGNSDGEITITVGGGTPNYTYNWSNSGTTATISGLPASNYTVTVSDAHGCTKLFTSGVSDSGSPIAIVDSIQSARCGENGSIYIGVSGGSGSYIYEWSNAETTEDIEGFEPGEYWVTITDGTCHTMLSAEIPYIIPENQEICVVTVDQNTAKNLVVWEKVEASDGVDHYNVYREGFVADDYQLVGTVDAIDMSEFSDPIASPFTRSWKYKISSEDACGNESALSDAHKTIHLSISLGLGGAINLMWDDYDGFEYYTYYINRHTTANGWEVIDSLPTYLHSYSDTPPSLYGLWYTVTVNAPGQCVPTSDSKANGGPYYQSTSNIEDEGAIDLEVNNKYEDQQLIVFPNPNNGQFIIEFNEFETGNYEIIDLSGKVIAQENFNNIKQIKHLDQLEKGIYLVNIQVDSKYTKSIKIVVQ